MDSRRDPPVVTPTLRGAAEGWATPNAHDGRRPGADIHSTQGRNLCREAAEWATPTAAERTHDPRLVDHGVQLANQVSDWRSPASQDAGITTERLIAAEGQPWTPGQRAYDRETGRMCQTGLVQQAETVTASSWPGPAASEVRQGYQQRPPGMASEQGQQSLSTIAMDWPGPATRDHKGSSDQPMIIRQDGSQQSRLCNLDAMAERSFRPPSSPAPPTAAGPSCSSASPNTNPPSPRRKLNPCFVEALMRWPSGLSGFARPETAWTRWWLLMPSYLSALLSARSAAPAQARLL